jgi:glucose-1-phosphate thymidylyltransferase
MHVFILAGGFATRLWPLSELRPKPLLPIAGKPILTYLIEGIPKNLPIAVSTNAVFENEFKRWASTLDRPVSIVIEQTNDDSQKLGTLGALNQWVERYNIDDDILFLLGDNYFSESIENLIKTYDGSTPFLIAYDIEDKQKAKKFGIAELDNQGRVISFEEKPDNPKSTLVNTGCSILPKAHVNTVLKHAENFPDNAGEMFVALQNANVPIDCVGFMGDWVDIGSFQAYSAFNKQFTGTRTIVKPGASIDKNSETHNGVVLGEGSEVQRCVLNNVVVFEGCVLHDCI